MTTAIILLSGTPGTGKTTVAKYLNQQYGYRIVSLGEEVIKHRLYSEEDTSRDTKIVDEHKFHTFFSNLIENIKDNVILEGHYADLIKSSKISTGIVLRCHPHVLETRLSARNYSSAKVRENIQAELVGDSTSYLLDHPNLSIDSNIFEVRSDTFSLNELGEILHSIIEHPAQNTQYQAGAITWLSDPTVDLNRFFDPFTEEKKS